MLTYLIVGNGPAGVSAVERIRQIDAQGRVVLVSGENNLPYSRIMLPEHMNGELKEADLYIRPDTFYQDLVIESRLGCRVEKLRVEACEVELDTGESLKYDRLLIATGSRPVVPRWVDRSISGIFCLWDKADSNAIQAYLPGVERTVVIGGGLVGLQAARALRDFGLQVSIVEKADRLMPAQLDSTASEMLQATLLSRGIEVLLNTEVKSLIAKGGRIRQVETDTQTLAADLVILAIGVEPNWDFIEGTEIQKDKGLLVNEYLETSGANVYAAGDVAQSRDPWSGAPVVKALWPNAIWQGKVAGANMAGVPEVFDGCYALNSTQLFGLSLIAMGQTFSGPGLTEEIVRYPHSNCYQKLLFAQERLVGMLFVGSVQKAGIIYQQLGQPWREGRWNGLSPLDVNNLAV